MTMRHDDLQLYMVSTFYKESFNPQVLSSFKKFTAAEEAE